MGSDYSEFDENVRRKSSRRKFNTKLDVDHLAVSENDRSFRAQLIRTMANGVSQFITPRQLISLLFVIAAYTIVFLIANICSDVVFIFYEIFYDFSDEVKLKLGSEHDVKIRFFSAVFSVLAIMVELDRPFISEKISILKSFIPRSALLFFVATLSEANPMIVYEWKKYQVFNDDDDFLQDDFNPNQSYFNTYNSGNSYNNGNSYNGNSYSGNSYSGNSYNSNAYKSSYSSSYNSNSYNNNNNNNYGNNNYSNSYSSGYNTNNYTSSTTSSTDDAEIYIRDEMPHMAIHLQSISATLLKVSVYLYLVLGLLCLDQFKPNAFVPPNDRKVSPEHLPKELSGKRSSRSTSRSRDINTEDRRSSSRPRNMDAEDPRNGGGGDYEGGDGRHHSYGQHYESPEANYAQYPGPGYA